MKRFLLHSIVLLFIVVGFVACNEENELNTTEDGNITEFSSDEKITLERAEEMIAFQLVVGEQELDYNKVFPKEESEKVNNTDYLEYDFEAEVTAGSATGAKLAADLKFKFTSDFGDYKIFRGVLDLDTDSRTRVSGLLTKGGVVYLFTDIPDVGYIKGTGRIDDNNIIAGSFQLFNNDDQGTGTWTANPTEPELNLLQTVENNPDLSIFLDGITESNLFGALQGEGDFTVFAPTNRAFEALDTIPQGQALREVLLYHLVPETFDVASLLENGSVTTTQREDITIEMVDGKVVLNGSIEIETADIEASNGIIHVITGVLIPPTEPELNLLQTVESNPDLSIFLDGITESNLFGALQGEGNFTVFAPTNRAFEALDTIPQGRALREVLLYHLVPETFDVASLLSNGSVTTTQREDITIEMIDGKVVLNGSVEIEIADIEASNGIIHIIDSVLIP